MFTGVDVSSTTVSAAPRASRFCGARDGSTRGTPAAASARMNSLAWLITGAAGISTGVIAGVQHRVTAESVVAIATLIIVAVGLVSRVLPRDAASV